MFGIFRQRFFLMSKISCISTRSSSLAKLRKSTGYSISNCKKALEYFPDDVVKAENWLHEEAKKKGWSKWSKIQNRSASQGLVGTYSNDRMAAMLEVNCETDFVAKNSEFQSFVEKVLISCINHTNEYNLNEDILKIYLDEAQLNSLKFDSTTIGELIGTVTCKFNEKTVTKRAVCYKVKEGISLSSISHPGTKLTNLSGASLGKYGALLAYKQDSLNDDQNFKDLGQNICQHIIGMSPMSVGKFTEDDLVALHEKNKTESICNKEHTNEGDEEQDTRQKTLPDNTNSNDPLFVESKDNAHINEKCNDHDDDDDNDDDESEDEKEMSFNSNVKDLNETRLLHQPFLLNPDVTVGETLLKSSIGVLEFERFECGEVQVQETEDNITQSVKA